jgi:hypothetical protein
MIGSDDPPAPVWGRSGIPSGGRCRFFTQKAAPYLMKSRLVSRTSARKPLSVISVMYWNRRFRYLIESGFSLVIDQPRLLHSSTYLLMPCWMNESALYAWSISLNFTTWVEKSLNRV